MQLISDGDHPGKSSVMFLPMIDMNPSDMTCINSTLHFVSDYADYAKRHDVVPVVTFDQPLWWKAMTITEGAPLDSHLHSIIPRLGGFHTLRSFLGSTGHLMSGTGLQELLEVIFAVNTVPHMISGKAYARAVRGYFLIDAVLHTLLLSKVCGTKPTLPSQESDEASVDSLLPGISDLYDDLISGTVAIEDVESLEMIKSLQVKLKSVTDTAESESLTSKLWLMYM